MGSRALERSGHRVIAYDARAHGKSDPASTPDDYGYERLARRSAGRARRPRHRARRPRRRFDGRAHVDGVRARAPRARRRPRDPDPGVSTPRTAVRTRWTAGTGWPRACAKAGWRASSPPTAPRRCPRNGSRRSTACLHQRLAAHDHLEALADALQAVPRSRPFEAGSELTGIAAPTVIVASRDEVDPEHPYATGERYAEAIPGARLVSEEPGHLPAGVAGRAGVEGDQRGGGVCGNRAMSSSAHSTTSSRS